MNRAVILYFVFFLALPAQALAHGGVHREIRQLSAQIEKQPDLTSLRLERARAYRVQGDLSRAWTDVEHALNSDPAHVEARLLGGMILHERGLHARALKLLPTDGPDHLVFVSRWSRARALVALRKPSLKEYARAARLGSHIDFVLDYAHELARTGHKTRATRLLEDRLITHDGAEVLRIKLVRLYESQAKWAKVIGHATAGARNARLPTRWLLRRATAHEQLDHDSQALVDRRTALKHAHRSVEIRRSALALTDRARVFLSLNDHKNARRDLSEALERMPKYAPALELLGGLEG